MALEDINVTLRREFNKFSRDNDVPGLVDFIYKNLPIPVIIGLCAELYVKNYKRLQRIRITQEEFETHFMIIKQRSTEDDE